MSITEMIRAFVTVFPAELPDKTMIATIILVTRFHRPMWVWLGATAAFIVHATVAVAAGSLLGLLPPSVLSVAIAALFGAGAVVLFRQARSHASAPDELAKFDVPLDTGMTEVPSSTRRVSTTPATLSTARAAFMGSAGLILLAEWGDLTQLATASLAAKSASPASTGIGALLALSAVAAIAATAGRQLVRRVPLHRINFIGAAVFAILAAWSLIDVL